MADSKAAGAENKMQHAIETKVVPALNKITSNYWFSLSGLTPSSLSSRSRW